ncbi:hypothetical protein CO612_01170 [Lysobacteraceae bacterium NML71-0210]|nr:hypothetical protein CO612_01170 [Xanthomonadaceae bacterium NML71-0210]
MSNIARTLAATSLLLALAAPLADAAELRAFDATYRASYNNMAADASMSLKSNGQSRWTYTMNVQNALVRLTRSAEVDAAGERLRPLSNREDLNLVVKRRSKQGRYDWTSRQARWSGDVKADRQGPIALQAGDVDGMTLNLAIVQDTLANRPLRYRLIENGKASTLSFNVAGRESLTVSGTPTPTIRVVSSNGDTTRTLWIAEGIPVPVRIQQREDDGDTIDLNLQSIR